MNLGLLEVLDGCEVSIARHELDRAIGAMDCGVNEVDGVLVCFDCVLEPLWMFGWLLCRLCFRFGCGCLGFRGAFGCHGALGVVIRGDC